MTGGKNEKNWQKLIAATVSQLNCNFNLWKRSFRARLSFQNWKLKLRKTKPNRQFQRGADPSIIRPKPNVAETVAQTCPIHLLRYVLCCKT